VAGTIAIIPARGASKGVPRKNIRNLAGKPLIAHSIEHAKQSKYVDGVFVSTDDDEIAAVAVQFGAEIIKRPKALAGDLATSESALVHAMQWYAENRSVQEPNLIVFLQCTSPLRGTTDIDDAIDTLHRENADSLLTVCNYHRFIWQNREDGPISLNYDYKNRLRRQELESQYIENGSIYLFKPWVLRKYNNRLGGRVALHVMNSITSHEIDALVDFAVIESLMRAESSKVD